MSGTQTSTGIQTRNMMVNITSINGRTNGKDGTTFFGGDMVTKKSGKKVQFNADNKYVAAFLAATGRSEVPSDVLLDVFGFFNSGKKFVVRKISIAKSLDEIKALSEAKKARLAAEGTTAPAETPAAAEPGNLDDEIPF